LSALQLPLITFEKREIDLNIFSPLKRRGEAGEDAINYQRKLVRRTEVVFYIM
jgi:hypothetical protein